MPDPTSAAAVRDWLLGVLVAAFAAPDGTNIGTMADNVLADLTAAGYTVERLDEVRALRVVAEEADRVVRWNTLASLECLVQALAALAATDPPRAGDGAAEGA